jgi:hypothetical protein
VRNLPFHDVPLHLGLNTFYNPETQAGGGFSAVSNMDGNREYRSLATIGGSAKATASVTDNILSCHYFEYTALDRTRQRAQLFYTDAGALYLGDTSSPTSEGTGITLATTGLRGCVLMNQLYLSSPALTVNDSGGYRYDGVNVRTWGVAAPADYAKVLSWEWEEDFAFEDDSAAESPSGLTTGDETSNFFIGSGGLSVEKTTTASTTCSFSITDVRDLTAEVGLWRLFFYLPPTALPVFNYIQIKSIDGNNNAHYRLWRWYKGDLRAGWNVLVWDFDDSDSENLYGGGANHTDWLFEFVTNSATDTFSGLILNSFQGSTSIGYPTLAVGAAGNLTGDYRYRVSFVSEDGTESNVGPVSGTVTLTADKASISEIPVANDPQVAARRIYRDKDADGIFKLVTTIPDNTTTTYTDNTADASLGGAVAPIAGDDLLDNTPPTRFSAVCAHQGRIFGVDADAPNTVWPSDIGVPGAFPIAKQLTFEDTIVAMVSQQNGLMLYGTDHTYILTGDGTEISPWYAAQLTDRLGADTYRSVETIRNFNCVIHERRVYLYEDIREPWYISGPIQDQLDAYDAEDIFVVHDVKRTRLLFFVDATNVAFSYNYGSKALMEVSPDGPGIDPFDPRTGVWSKITFPDSYSIRCAMHADSSTEVSRIVVGCDDAKAYYIGEDDYSWETTASTEAVAASFTTHAFPLGEREYDNPMAPPSSGGRGEPRFLRIDAVGVGASTTWTFTINLLNDPGASALATVNVTATVAVGQNSLYLPIPPVGRAAWASISASCSSSTGRAKFRLIRLYYMPRSRFRGPKES